MRTLTIPAALLLATVFATGCSDQKAPTELSEGELGPQFNQAPVVFTDPVAFTAFNPCTGGADDFSGTVTVRVHFFEPDTDPVRHHFNAHVLFDLESAAGFSGSQVQQEVDNGTPEDFAPDEEFSFTAVFNVDMSNDTHQRLKVHLNFHITIRNGVVVRAEIFKLSFNCVGKPDA